MNLKMTGWLLAGAFGTILANEGITIGTWQFWALLVIYVASGCVDYIRGYESGWGK